MRKYGNKVILLFLALCCSLFYACEKIFFEAEPDFGKLETKEDIRTLLNGGWEAFNSEHYWDQYKRIISRADDITFYDYFDDDGGDYTKSFEDEYWGFSNESYFEYDINPIYKVSYIALVIFNKIITHFEGEEIPTDIKPVLGEAYLARGYIYFTLTRFFGEIPLITDIDVDFNAPLVSIEKSYIQIIADLEQAAKLLPDQPVTGRTNRNLLCSGSAKALMAEVYLAMGGYPLYDETKYQLAAKIAGEVIQKKGIYNYDLVDDYQIVVNHEPTSESILSITLDRLAMEGFSKRNRKRYTFYPEWAYYNQFPLNYRKKVCMNTIIKNQVDLPNDRGTSQLNDYVVAEEIDTISLQDGPRYIYNQKIGYNKYRTFEYWENRELPDPTISLIRYAHTLLTYAESKARSGKLDASAYEAVNSVRRRANNLPPGQPSPFDLKGLSSQQFIDSVIAERKWELCAEPVGRWFDIIRLDLLEKVEQQRHDNELQVSVIDEIFLDGGYFAPIPE